MTDPAYPRPLWNTLRPMVGVIVTVAVLVAAVLAGRALWAHYQADPWTRDGRVRADVVQIAPDVQGLVTRVNFTHDQMVHRGDVLFEIDPARYELAVRQSQDAIRKAGAATLRARAILNEARREAARNKGLGDLVSAEMTEQSQTKVAEGEAALAEAQTATAEATTSRELARLNLSRTRVRAPMDGRLSDFALRVGDYVSPGKAVLALIDLSSIRVEGYFEETKLPHIRVGQAARIRLMGERETLSGHVTSIAGAIEDHDRTATPNLLPAINPSFSWVRLAQRVPVRIALDHPRPDIALIAGRTANVTLVPGREKQQ